MLIESGERWRRPDEPPPDRWTDAGLQPLKPWAHVLILSTLALMVPGVVGVLIAVTALGLALEVAFRHAREHRRAQDAAGRRPYGPPGLTGPSGPTGPSR